jgi:hypothetical protein
MEKANLENVYQIMSKEGREASLLQGDRLLKSHWAVQLGIDQIPITGYWKQLRFKGRPVFPETPQVDIGLTVLPVGSMYVITIMDTFRIDYP